jgi:hypothetical protein
MYACSSTVCAVICLVVGLGVLVSGLLTASTAFTADASRDFEALGPSCKTSKVVARTGDYTVSESNNDRNSRTSTTREKDQCDDVQDYFFEYKGKSYQSVQDRTTRPSEGTCDETEDERARQRYRRGQRVNCWKSRERNVGPPSRCSRVRQD